MLIVMSVNEDSKIFAKSQMTHAGNSDLVVVVTPVVGPTIAAALEIVTITLIELSLAVAKTTVLAALAAET